MSLPENSALIPCAAASMLSIFPAKGCLGPVASCRSLLVIRRAAFAMILLWVSAIPIGLTPGHLSSAIKREASRGEMLFGSTRVLHNLWARQVQSLFQQWTSRPERPAAPLTRPATLLMQLAVIWSYTTKRNRGWSALTIIKVPGQAGVGLGCLERKISSTVFTPRSPRTMLSSTCRIPPLPCWASSWMAALNLLGTLALRRTS